MKKFLQLSILTVVFVSMLTSCKKEYEAPPQSGDPVFPSDTKFISIKSLKARHTVAGGFDAINDSVVIVGVVIANDKSGNFYKELYIRDANGSDSGCIAVELASNALYANYPVGRKLFIKCKGLYLSDYKNMIQLGVKSISNGLVSLEGIAAPLIPNYVIGGSLNNNAAPKVVTEADLALGNPAMQTNTLGDLLTLKGYEFIIGDTKRSYADTTLYHSTLKSMTHIKSCSSPTQFIVLTSGYADFATKAPQSGNGDFTGIYTVYNTDKQFIIRDTTDVKFNNPRCFLFEEDFGAFTTGTACASLPGWQNITESGNTCYTIASFSGNIFAKVSSFTDATLPTTNIKSWLIMPSINMPNTGAPKLSYTCAMRYTVGTLTALVSTDYDGTSQNPSNFTWTTLNTIQANSASFTPFLSFPTAGGYDLSPYKGKKIYIAFRYDVPAGSNKNQVATYEPDDIKISSN